MPKQADLISGGHSSTFGEDEKIVGVSSHVGVPLNRGLLSRAYHEVALESMRPRINRVALVEESRTGSFRILLPSPTVSLGFPFSN